MSRPFLPDLPPTRSEVDLVRAWQRGDRDARDRVLAAWAPTVLAWCMRLGGPSVDAHDAAQDVLVVMLTRGDRCREPERFGAWVFGVTRKVLLKHRTRGWIRRWVGGAPPDRADEAPGPRVRAQLSETGRRVQAVLEQLAATDREALVLCDLEGRSVSEVADLLDLPLGTVKSRVRRAREHFRTQAERMSLHVPIAQALSEGMGH